MKNKVMVGVPTYPGHSYCKPELVKFLEGLDAEVLIAWNGDTLPKGFGSLKVENMGRYDNFDETLSNPGWNKDLVLKQRVLVAKHNLIRKRFLESDCTHLLHLESDVIPPHDILSRLLSHDVDVVSALYFIASQQKAVFRLEENEYVQMQVQKAGLDGMAIAHYVRQSLTPCVFGYQRTSTGGFSTPSLTHRLWQVEDWIEARNRGYGLVPVVATGVGCILLSRKAMTEVTFMDAGEFSDYMEFDEPVMQLTDWILCSLLKSRGYQVHVDIDAICQHHSIDTTNDPILMQAYDNETMKPS